MLASSGQQGENERQRKKKRTGTQETTVNKCTKKCAVRAKLLLFVCFYFLPFSLPTPLNITRLYFSSE